MKAAEEKIKEMKTFIAENFFTLLAPKEALQHLFNAKD